MVCILRAEKILPCPNTNSRGAGVKEISIEIEESVDFLPQTSRRYVSKLLCLMGAMLKQQLYT